MSGIPFSCFETNSFSRNQKYDAFRESINVIFDITRPVASGERFFGCIKTYLIDEMLLVNVKATGQEFLRPSSLIAKDTTDHFLIQIFHEGKTTPLDFIHDRACDNGKILVLDASKPWRAFNTNFNNLTLVIPRRLLRDKLLAEHSQHGRILDAGLNPFAEILYKFMLSLEDSVEKVPAEDAHSLISPSSDLVAAALNFNMDKSSGERELVKTYCETAQKFRIKEFVEKNISNPGFKSEDVQRAFNMSRSQLYRIFSGHGGVMNYLRKRRMDIAYKRLLSRSKNILIAQVAYEVGFLNESSFSRAFKAFFGISPKEASSEMYVLNSKSQALHFNSGRVWESWFSGL